MLRNKRYHSSNWKNPDELPKTNQIPLKNSLPHSELVEFGNEAKCQYSGVQNICLKSLVVSRTNLALTATISTLIFEEGMIHIREYGG